nr:thiolase family protein [Lysinibacillus endophyticus]
MSSRLIADPFTLLQCSANNGDGAAAVLVCATDRAKEFSDVSIKTEASVITSGLFKGGYRDLTWAEITYRAVNEAYQQANVKPEQIDMVEMHDAFTIAEVLYYEAMGFCEHGKGVEFLRDGKSQIDGQVAVNPSGGLISRGHPLGATGVAQIAETFWQLTGQAGKRQVKNPQYALTHVTGGGISGVDNGACGVHIFSAV